MNGERFGVVIPPESLPTHRTDEQVTPTDAERLASIKRYFTAAVEAYGCVDECIGLDVIKAAPKGGPGSQIHSGSLALPDIQWLLEQVAERGRLTALVEAQSVALTQAREDRAERARLLSQTVMREAALRRKVEDLTRGIAVDDERRAIAEIIIPVVRAVVTGVVDEVRLILSAGGDSYRRGWNAALDFVEDDTINALTDRLLEALTGAKVEGKG